MERNEVIALLRYRTQPWLVRAKPPVSIVGDANVDMVLQVATQHKH